MMQGSEERGGWCLKAIQLGLTLYIPSVTGRAHCLLAHLFAGLKCIKQCFSKRDDSEMKSLYIWFNLGKFNFGGKLGI